MGIYDIMRYVWFDVCIICMGIVVSMGVFFLSGGIKGKRMSLFYFCVMIY